MLLFAGSVSLPVGARQQVIESGLLGQPGDRFGNVSIFGSVYK